MKRVKSYRDLVTIKEGKEYLKCTKCNTEKELTEENFYKKGKTSEDWICVCRECKKGYYQENKEHKQEYQLKYAEENKDYYHEYLKQYNQGGKGAVTISMKDFRQGIIPEVNYKPMKKLIHMDGEVITKDGRKFTRLIGGFGESNPIFTIWQVSELLNTESRTITRNFDNNISKFENGVDYIDLKIDIHGMDNEINLKDFYHHNKINKTKQWIIFSQSGLLKMLKISNTKESWDIYESFIEDYFKTKVELAVAEKTIQENSDVLLDTKKMLLGSAFLETDEKKKFDMFMQIEDINRQLIDNAKTLAKEETIEQFKEVLAIADRFTNSKECYDIGIFSKLLDIPNMGRTNMFKFLREEKMLQGNNAPYQNMTDKFKVIKVNNNGYECRKTLLKGDGIKFVVNRLIKKGYIDNLTTDEVLEKLKDIQAA